MNLKLIEPLRELFKDEVRELGKSSVFQMRSFTDSLSPDLVLL